MDRVILAISALFLNMILGGPRAFYQALGSGRVTRAPLRFVRDAERRLNRDHRSVSESAGNARHAAGRRGAGG